MWAPMGAPSLSRGVLTRRLVINVDVQPQYVLLPFLSVLLLILMSATLPSLASLSSLGHSTDISQRQVYTLQAMVYGMTYA